MPAVNNTMLFTEKLIKRVDLMLSALNTHTKLMGQNKSSGSDDYVYYIDSGDGIYTYPYSSKCIH